MNNDPRYQAPPGAQYPGQPPMQPQYPGQPPQYAQYPQQPTIQAQPPKKKRNKLAIGCATLIVAIVIISIISAIGSGGKSTTTQSSSDSNASQQSVPSKPQTWQTTHTYSGNGSKKTETIAVGNDWKIQWSCTPGSFSGIDYNVIIMVYNSDATMADPSAVNSTCKTGNASGETEEHTGGNIYLDITSEGDWSLTIQELK